MLPTNPEAVPEQKSGSPAQHSFVSGGVYDKPPFTPSLPIMSGFEVAGVVLGTLPLVIKAVEAYIGFIKDWGKAASELKSINR